MTLLQHLANSVVEPSYPARKSPSKLDDYEQTLTNWLFRESRRHRKQRRTIKQLHRDLNSLGVTGSYDRVAAFARQWREQRQELKRTAGGKAYVPLQFSPGEAFRAYRQIMDRRPIFVRCGRQIPDAESCGHP